MESGDDGAFLRFADRSSEIRKHCLRRNGVSVMISYYNIVIALSSANHGRRRIGMQGRLQKEKTNKKKNNTTVFIIICKNRDRAHVDRLIPKSLLFFYHHSDVARHCVVRRRGAYGNKVITSRLIKYSYFNLRPRT